MVEKNINNVAIYLRKSRREIETEDVLKKHELRLTAYANKKGWEYEIFKEVASGERISNRPVIQKLLDLIEDDIYDGILVVDYDRLCRGGSKDFGEIIEVCQMTDTYIITPNKTYNVNQNSDLMMLGVQNVFANNELRVISKRLVDGKKDGAKLGKWTNGKPPYPYKYNKKIILDENNKEKVIGEIIVDKDEEGVYKYMKDMYLSGQKGFEAIAFELNRKEIPSPSNKNWTSITVQRILVHEFHMGVVKYGKHKWGKDRNGTRRILKKRDDNEIATGNGNHQLLKTKEEHFRILEIMNNNRKIPRKSRAGTFPTSGLLYCKKCGSRMGYSIGRVEVKTGKQYHYTKCTHKNPKGEKCEQRGIKMNEEFYNAIYNNIINNYLSENHIKEIQENDIKTNVNNVILINNKQKFDEAKKKLDRIFMAYENDIYSLQEFILRKKPQEKLINKLSKEIKLIEDEKNKLSLLNSDELLKRIEKFKIEWDQKTTAKEKNILLRSIVSKIHYDRNDNEVTLEIEYL